MRGNIAERKRWLSIILCIAMVMSFFSGLEPTVQAAGSNSTYAKHVVSSGENMNLTKEGTTDWILFSENGIYTRKADVEEAIQYHALPGVKMIGNAGDGAMSYSFKDGNPVENGDAVVRAAVFGSNNTDQGPQGILEEGVGYTLALEAKDVDRIFTFVYGIWEASADVTIKTNDVTLYEENFTAGGANVIKYTVNLAAGETLYVEVRKTAKTNEWGNVTLGGVALKDAESDNENETIIADSRKVVNGDSMNLTKEGTLDWIYLDGEQDDRKAGGNVLTVKTLENSIIRTMTDSKVSYSWTDGSKRLEVNNTLKGKIFLSQGYELGTLPSNAQIGYRIEVPAGDKSRVLTFAPGVWEGSIQVTATDGNEEVFYDSYSARGSAEYKMYNFILTAGQKMDVTVKLVSHSHADGNVTVGGITLKEQDMAESIKGLLANLVERTKTIDFSNYRVTEANALKEEVHKSNEILADEDATEDEVMAQYQTLKKAYNTCLDARVDGRYTYETNSGLCSSFGWEGDRHAPIAYLDGSYRLRDRNNSMISFGVRDIPGKIKWYNAEGYLPCFISEYTKDGLDYVVENFANKHEIEGNAYEIAYSRMTVTNTSNEAKDLPVVSSMLIPLNEAAKTAEKIDAGETVIREYAIGADRFDGKYEYPSDEKIAALGNFEKNYEEMKAYWNNRLDALTNIVELPNMDLINAYKAGFIYTLLIRDDIIKEDGSVVKELHVGENGYDEMFDHDTIGIVAALLTIGDFTYAKDYLGSLPAQLQYDDAKWKFSWPFAVYLTKTGDIEFIEEKFDMIKNNTHKVETDRDYNMGGIIKKTWAIDSYDYWLIDNWSALAGLTTYQYLCDKLFEETGEEPYSEEKQWAKETYDDLLKCVEEQQEKVRKDYDYPYLSIDMTKPTELSARSDPRDANWASMFLFGRWAWDGYLFGANQENSTMIDLIDTTYQHGFDRRAEYGEQNNNPNVGDTIYNFGGYPHGIYSSAYNAGYGSSALRGEAYRESGIRSYEFMIDKAMSGPFGWWEGVDWPNEKSPWDIDHAAGGGGSCQHMWGQSTATKVLFDSLVAEKVGESIIIGRGIPKEWNTDGQTVEIENVLVNEGKSFGYKMQTKQDKIVIDFSGECLDVPFSIELPVLKNNIAQVTVDSDKEAEEINQEMGTVLVAAGTKKVIIELGEKKEDTPNNPSIPNSPAEPGNGGNTEVTLPSVSDKNSSSESQTGTVDTMISGTAIVTTTEKEGAFFDANGKKITNAIVKTKEGKNYIVDANGDKMVMAIVKTAEGQKYITGRDGAVVKGKVVTRDGKKFYTTKATGKVVKNKMFNVNGKRYIASKSGKLYTSTWITKDGKRYYCNKNGVVTKEKEIAVIKIIGA